LAGAKARGSAQLYLQWAKEQAKERDREKNVRREREDIERSSNDHREPFVVDCCWLLLLLLLLPSMQYLNSSVLAFQFAGCCYCHLHRVYISVPLFCYYFGYMCIYLGSRQWFQSALEQMEVTTERVFYIICTLNSKILSAYWCIPYITSEVEKKNLNKISKCIGSKCVNTFFLLTNKLSQIKEKRIN
jgi:hypothetical protein